MTKPCQHLRLKQENKPCTMCGGDPDDPQCCWAECSDCGGMLHMRRVTEEELDPQDEIIDFDSG